MTFLSKNNSNELKRWGKKKNKFLDKAYGRHTNLRKEYNRITNGKLNNIKNFGITLSYDDITINL